MKAKKENKIYTIAGPQVKEYLKAGYDIYDDAGALIQRSPSSTVPYAQYKAAIDKIAELEAKLVKANEAEAAATTTRKAR